MAERDWFEMATVGAGAGGELHLPKRLAMPQPGPAEAVIAVCAEDGAQAFAAFPKSVLAEDGIMPSVLASLEETQAEARRQRGNPGGR